MTKKQDSFDVKGKQIKLYYTFPIENKFLRWLDMIIILKVI